MVMLVMLFGVVLPLTVCVAIGVSRPLESTSRESTAIIKNIGGDLFAGLTIDQKLDSGIGEVRELRRLFVGLLNNLKRKREHVHTPNPNPVFQAGLSASRASDAPPAS